MTTTMTHDRPAADALAALEVDFSMIRQKLAAPEDGLPWSTQRLDLAEQEYRKFLALCRAYPSEAIVPCKLVDEFWHAHILDTRAYREDTQQYFGFFYDHFPYFGLRDEADAADLRNAYDRTLVLYDANFGDAPDDTWRTARGAKCRTGCKPVKCR
jgi:hypothetical protein